jgi:hypothetical protein
VVDFGCRRRTVKKMRVMGERIHGPVGMTFGKMAQGMNDPALGCGGGKMGCLNLKYRITIYYSPFIAQASAFTAFFEK